MADLGLGCNSCWGRSWGGSWGGGSRGGVDGGGLGDDGTTERGVAILLTIISSSSAGPHTPGFAVVCRQRGSHGEFRGALVELSL